MQVGNSSCAGLGGGREHNEHKNHDGRNKEHIDNEFR